MRAAKKTAGNIQILRDLVPLNALSEARFNKISDKIVIEVVKSGRYLFRKGDRDNRTIYLLEGKVDLLDGSRNVAGDIVAGTEDCRHPLVNQQPRPLSAMAVGKVVIAYLDSGMLDVFLACDLSNPTESIDFDVKDTGDWMTRLLKSETFSKLPPSKLQGLLMKMKPYPVEQGDVVISQGEEGDYFYTIHEGLCQVTQRQQDGSEVELAQLGQGDSFGEEALVSDARRNATITMLTSGQLMRLAKDDFDDLLKTQLLRYVDYQTAMEMVSKNAVWIDVRTPEEYENEAFKDSVNIPVASLRGELPELVFNTSYIVCCDNGWRSDSAAFVLSHKGYDVYVLEGGIGGILADGQAEDAIVVEEPVDLRDESGSDSDESAHVADLRRENKALQEANTSLAAELEEQRGSAARLDEQIEQLRGELGESDEKLAEIYAHKGKQAEQKQLLEEQFRAQLEEQSAQLDSLKNALAAEQQKNVALQEQATAVSAEIEAQAGSSAHDLQALSAEKQQLTGELTAAQGRIAALEEKFQAAIASDASGQDKAAAAMQQLREENDRLSGQLTTLESATAKRDDELAAANEKIESLQKESRKLLGDREATEDLQQKLQAGYEAERDELRKQVEKEQANSAELREQLVRLEKSQREEHEQLEQQSEKLQVQADTQQQEMSVQLEELQQALADSDARQAQLGQERDELKQQFAGIAAEKQELADEIVELNQQNDAARASLDSRVSELQAQVDEERQRATVATQQVADKDRQIEALELSTVAGEEAKQVRDEEFDLLKQQLEDAQAALSQREENARVLQTEFAESLSKSHDELTRKNDTEKDMQGQIDRLRKKLEQVSLDGQKTRESSLDELDSVREELHHERQARAEERAQMAARQRQLKEQLASIATQHEANISDQSGAIEQARDAAREEERSRLQSMLETQAAETEDQLARVQAELQQAHEEIAVLDQQEKARRQAEIDAIQEQNEQAEAAITQLEKQLRQLTNERDDALDDQHELRVKMNALRGEVEVARGLMTAGGKGKLEDTESLRTELEETRKNVKIAVRLRAEAEAAREKMAAEVYRLRALTGNEVDTGQPLNVPSLDKFDPASGEMDEQAVPLSLVPDSMVVPGRALGGAKPRRQVHHYLRNAVLGMLLLGGVGLAAWWMAGKKISTTGDIDEMASAQPQAPATQTIDSRVAPPATGSKPRVQASVEAEDATETAAQPSQPPAPMMPAIPPVELAEQASSLSPETMPATDKLSQSVDPQSNELVNEAVPMAPAGNDADASTAPVYPVPAGPPPVGNSFRDALKGGGKGPAMIELNAASFHMGSAGNSLNFDEGPRHTVKLRAFSISKREITFSDYDRFARATGRRLPYDEGWGHGKHPVINISWHDAVAYTRWLSAQTGEKYRLPSEAQWEYAARAGSQYSYWWAGSRGGIHANCFDCGSEWDGKQTAPVGSFSANRFGLFDMSGNVQEWTQDCYNSSYTGAPADGSAWVTPECTQRVVRGGAYSSPLDSLRSAKRGQLNQDTRLDNLGFRVVRIN